MHFAKNSPVHTVHRISLISDFKKKICTVQLFVVQLVTAVSAYLSIFLPTLLHPPTLFSTHFFQARFCFDCCAKFFRLQYHQNQRYRTEDPAPHESAMRTDPNRINMRCRIFGPVPPESAILPAIPHQSAMPAALAA